MTWIADGGRSGTMHVDGLEAEGAAKLGATFGDVTLDAPKRFL